MAIRKLDPGERRRLSRAIHLLCQVSLGPFWHGVPALRSAFAALVVFADDACPYETAYTDCRFRVGIHPKWLAEGVPSETLAVLLLHETMHCTQRHGPRLDPLAAPADAANVAGDLEINGLILEGCLGLDPAAGPARHHGRWELVPGRVADTAEGPVYQGMCVPGYGPFSGHPVRATAEQHLSLLQEQGSPQGGGGSAGQGGGEGGDGQGQAAGPWDDLTVGPADPRWDEAQAAGVHEVPTAVEARVREQVRKDVAEAAAASKGIGSGAMDALLQLCLEGLRPPQVDWRRVLSHVVAHSCSVAANGRSDYSMRRPNRRRMAPWDGGDPPVMPGFSGYSPKVCVALDTSGSMGKAEYERAMSELSGIVREAASDVGFFCVDTVAKSAPRPVSSWREAARGLSGGGGTDMAGAVEAVCALPARQRPDVLVIATDGYIPWESLGRSLLARNARRMQVVVVYWAGDATPEEAREREALLRRYSKGASVVAGLL